MAAREPQADLWDGKEVVGLFKYRMRVFYRHPPKNVKKRNWYANNIRGHSQEMAVVPLGPYICNARGDFFLFEHLPWGWAFIRSSSRMDSLPSSLPPLPPCIYRSIALWWEVEQFLLWSIALDDTALGNRARFQGTLALGRRQPRGMHSTTWLQPWQKAWSE